jgi:RNA polymerase sigma factor (TIGR02999 family)
MGDVTQILEAIERGDTAAAEGLFPLVYEQLRQLAAQKLSQEGPGQTLQATALVHEAYLKLVDVARADGWHSRRHFFAAASEAMRRILFDRARKRRSHNRGGGAARLDFDETNLAAPEAAEEILAIDEAVAKLDWLLTWVRVCPQVITVCGSSVSGYTPRDQGPYIEENLIAGLRRLFTVEVVAFPPDGPSQVL